MITFTFLEISCGSICLFSLQFFQMIQIEIQQRTISSNLYSIAIWSCNSCIFIFYYAYKAVQDNQAWLLQQLIFRSKYAQATHKIISLSSPPRCTYWVYERYYPAILINKKNHLCWRSRWKMRIGKLFFVYLSMCAA